MANKKLLTREEEQALGIKVQAGLEADEKLSQFRKGEISLTDEEVRCLEEASKERLKAREVFFEYNQGLVYQLALNHKRKISSTVEIAELYHEGIFGLYRAIDKYKPERGFKFSTMAYYWISLAINRSFNNTYRMVRLPENRIVDYSRITQIAKELDKQPADREVREKAKAELKLTDEYYNSIIAAAPNYASLDFKIGASEDGENNSKTLADFVSAEQASESAEDLALNSILFEENFIEPLKKLPETERAIVASSTGLTAPGIEALTRKEVKERYSVTDAVYNKVAAAYIANIQKLVKSKGLTMADFTGI